MESNLDLEDLPFVVFYQCRMCTHLFFDEIEKIFDHFDERHGAMIDCDELRTLVYTNGLKLGPRAGPGSSSPSTVKTEVVNEEAEEFDKNGEGEDHIIGHDSGEDELEQGEHEISGELEQNEEYNEEIYGDNAYNEEAVDEENGVLMKYHFNGFGGEEQLEDEEYDESTGEIVKGEDLYNGNEEDTQVDEDEDLETLPQGYNYDDSADYENGEEEENGEMDEEDLDDQAYDDDEQLDEVEDGEVRNDVAYSPNNGNGSQQNRMLKYGYACKFCGKFFTTRRGVESHEQHHKTQTIPTANRPNHSKLFPCKICKNKTFQSFKDLKLHVKTHTNERIHICKFCFSTFNNTASLTKHLTIHKRENPNKCFCGKTFVSANTLKIHKKIHTGIKPFVCGYYQCGRSFVTKSTLESHLRTHTGEKPYDCSFCSSSFTTSSAKYRHERHVHKAHGP